MRNLLIVARHEFLTLVRRRSFILTTLGLPVVFGLIVAIMILVAQFTADPRPIGYVDRSGLLAGEEAPSGVQAYSDEDAAFQALEEDRVRAVYVVGEDYLQSQQIELYYWDAPPDERAWSLMNGYLRAALFDEVEPVVRHRVRQGPVVTIYSADRSRSLSMTDPFALLLPIVTTVLLMVSSLTSSGYLLQAVASERLDRTIEVLILTVSPRDLLGGKALGLMAAALLQLFTWLAALTLALLLLVRLQPGLPPVQVPWNLAALVVLFYLPAFGLIAALMTAVGGVVRDISQGQLVTGMLTLPFILPVMAISFILADPTNLLVLFMTYFPLTAFITTIVRAGIGVAPVGQIVLSWLLLSATAIITARLGALLFRVGMLRTGKELSLRQIFGALRSVERLGR
ncbi:MAG TPA: ABC transporter permease [Chloroflexi bacterium]|jgi:ABC-2 type transport system permease protein|nr:ABC transporter permease [Chloroflexota bacterium]